MVETVLVYTLKRSYGLLLLALSLPLVAFCTKQSAPIIDYADFDELSVTLFASNSVNHQSAAVHNDYCIMITDTRSFIYLYNLAEKRMACSLALPPGEGKDFMGYTLFHCNQSTFGVDYYDENDYFPLLYISQRAGNDQRCFMEVYRICPTSNEAGTDFSSIAVELVQTIFFPPISMSTAGCTLIPGITIWLIQIMAIARFPVLTFLTRLLRLYISKTAI